jgi:protein-arginine kinase activator protein McsA
MPPEGYEERKHKCLIDKRIFMNWVAPYQNELKHLELLQKEDQAVKKENYLEAAKYRDIIKNLKK